jgi:pilus assembly protein CpaE
MDVLQRSAPVSVLDVPHQWSEWTRSVLASADEVVICASPDLANLRNTKNLIDSLRKMRPNDKMPHLVLNQVGMPKRPEIAERLLRTAGMRAGGDHPVRQQSCLAPPPIAAG